MTLKYWFYLFTYLQLGSLIKHNQTKNNCECLITCISMPHQLNAVDVDQFNFLRSHWLKDWRGLCLQGKLNLIKHSIACDCWKCFVSVPSIVLPNPIMWLGLIGFNCVWLNQNIWFGSVSNTGYVEFTEWLCLSMPSIVSVAVSGNRSSLQQVQKVRQVHGPGCDNLVDIFDILCLFLFFFFFSASSD